MRLRGAGTTGRARATVRHRSRYDGRQQVKDLGRIPIFARCNPSELRLVDILMCETHIPPGCVLVREGLPADQMLVVVSGRARLARGGEALGIAGPGACIAGRELRARNMNTLTMTADTPMVVRVASAAELRSLVLALPRVAFFGPLSMQLPERETAERSWPLVLSSAG
jgi:CRP-like cAMP-binding protein